jgi:2-desacetyl-2-hydroxyethyl bacteriochlorophyllide A dehydrogenase
VPSHLARAFWVVSPGRGEIRDAPLPSPSSTDVVVRTLFSGISRGTEALVFTGDVPAAEWQRMRAPFQEGDFPAPVKYGYCNVGLVEQGPDGLAGRTVFTLFPHQTHFVVPASAVHVVPHDVPAERAVLAANMETALNGVWDAAVKPGDRVVVIGAGTVGCLVAWLAGRIPGCEVSLVDVNASRAVVARTLGVSFAQPADVQPDADVVVHASGSPEGLALALRVAAFEAMVIEMSWYGTRQVALPLGESFHSRRLTLRSSQVGHVAASQRARWDYRRRMRLALSLLASPALDALVSGESEFDELPQVMHALATGAMGALCHRIRYLT